MADERSNTAFIEFMKRPEVEQFRRNKNKAYAGVSLQIRDEGTNATDSVITSWMELYEDVKSFVHEHIDTEIQDLEALIAAHMHATLKVDGAQEVVRQPFQKEKFMNNLRAVNADIASRADTLDARTLDMLELLGFPVEKDDKPRGGRS